MDEIIVVSLQRLFMIWWVLLDCGALFRLTKSFHYNSSFVLLGIVLVIDPHNL
jgi:hypothetical protein